MTWTKLPDHHFDELDVIELSRSARLLDIEATVYANKVLTDGRIPANALRRITDSAHVEADAAELVASGRWTITDSGWQIENWSDYQEPAERVRGRQRVNAARQARSRLHRSGDHSTCDRRWCKYVSNAVTDGVTDGASNKTPSRPDPSRPEGPGDGSDECPHGHDRGLELLSSGRPRCPFCRRAA
jgi:hypothetical protein